MKPNTDDWTNKWYLENIDFEKFNGRCFFGDPVADAVLEAGRHHICDADQLEEAPELELEIDEDDPRLERIREAVTMHMTEAMRAVVELIEHGSCDGARQLQSEITEWVRRHTWLEADDG